MMTPVFAVNRILQEKADKESALRRRRKLHFGNGYRRAIRQEIKLLLQRLEPPPLQAELQSQSILLVDHHPKTSSRHFPLVRRRSWRYASGYPIAELIDPQTRQELLKLQLHLPRFSPQEDDMQFPPVRLVPFAHAPYFEELVANLKNQKGSP